MMPTPTVSILLPCYDDAATLPMALASLIAQTVDDWECIVVDDGSTPPIRPIVEAFDDDRFRLRVLSKNRGRAVARQTALKLVRGRFVCMLDADDWYYPDKLERQLELMERHPDLAAVTTSVSVVDREGRLKGVRSFASSQLDIRTGDPNRRPAVAFPSIMIRRESALSARFDPQLRRGEDGDYLMKVLGGRRFGVADWIGYAYRDFYAPEMLGEALLSYRCQRRLFRRRFLDAPLDFGAQYLRSLIRTAVYGAARAANRGQWLFDRRNQPPTPGVRNRFEAHRRAVREALPARQFSRATPP